MRLASCWRAVTLTAVTSATASTSRSSASTRKSERTCRGGFQTRPYGGGVKLAFGGSDYVNSTHLDKLNPDQRRAVEHGINDPVRSTGGPLLVIAGAGSGKTSTLAHRVAHLVVKGADPRRILLLTFSRRAAQEMTRRVTRIAGAALGARSAAAQGLTWSGTFHSVRARLLREYADLIGLSPAFTINDREDSADLMK